MTEFKYGTCGCEEGVGDGCCHGRGPAAYEVTRRGGRVKVCTKCALSSDTDQKILPKMDDSYAAYLKHDPFGAIVLTLRLGEERGRPN